MATDPDLDARGYILTVIWKHTRHSRGGRCVHIGAVSPACWAKPALDGGRGAQVVTKTLEKKGVLAKIRVRDLPCARGPCRTVTPGPSLPVDRRTTAAWGV
jgi:hypothetical protein